MDAAFTAEQDEMRRTLREVLGKRCGPDEVKAAVRTAAGHDRELWRQLAQQLGLPGIAVAEEYGGVGCTPADLALACEETGRVLLPSPLLATAALAVPLITTLGTTAQCSALLPPLAAGGLTAALAVPGPALSTALALTGDNAPGEWAGGGRAGGVQARTGDDGGWRLYGEAAQVLDGHSASSCWSPRTPAASPGAGPCCSSYGRTPPGSSGRGRPPWTRPARRPASNSATPRQSCSEPIPAAALTATPSSPHWPPRGAPPPRPSPPRRPARPVRR